MIKRLLTTAWLLWGVALSMSWASEKVDEAKQCAISRIHVSSMGTTDDAKLFVSLIENALAESGFEPVEKPEEADAILSGTVTVRGMEPASDEGSVSWTAKLVAKDGIALWRGSKIPNVHGYGWKRTPPWKSVLETRASELVKAIKKACTKGWSVKE